MNGRVGVVECVGPVARGGERVGAVGCRGVGYGLPGVVVIEVEGSDCAGYGRSARLRVVGSTSFYDFFRYFSCDDRFVIGSFDENGDDLVRSINGDCRECIREGLSVIESLNGSVCIVEGV